MKRYIVVLFLIFLIPAFTPRANNLDDLFNKIRNDRRVTTDSVCYRGSDRSKAGGFYMQRGTGSGWTRGERLTLVNAKPKLLRQIKDTYDDYLQKGYGYSKDNWVCLFFEERKTFFGYSYSAEDNTMWLLKASTDGEICIPGVWTQATYVDAAEHNPFQDADENQLKMLGLARLWEGVNRWFVFRDKMTVNWDSLYVATMPEMLAAKTPQEWTAVLDKMVAHAHDGHTLVYSYSDERCTPPFSTVMIDGKVYVREVYDNDLGVLPGERITAIDDCPVLDYADKNVIPYIASSTPQWTIHQAFDGGGLLRRLPADTVRLTLSDGKKIEYAVRKYQNVRINSDKSIFKLTKITPDILVLKISSFMDNDFKHQFANIYDTIYASKALIIDVRDNAGGNSGNSDFIIRMICHDSIPTATWTSPVIIPAFVSWGQTRDSYKGGGSKMAPFTDVPLYTKPIVVLANRGTFSAAEDFVSLFRGAKRGIVIGTPTGGSTGNGVRVELIPHHSMANICSKHDISPDGTEFVGIGHLPDIHIEETWESIFLHNTDAATTEAISYLTKLLQDP